MTMYRVTFLSSDMKKMLWAVACIIFSLCTGTSVKASDSNSDLVVHPTAAKEGRIITLWPLFDYRENPDAGYSNLSILGPLFKREHSGTSTKTAFRPFFYSLETPESDDTDILYPIASVSRDNDNSDSQVLKLYQHHVSRKGSVEEKEETMLFPFYISGVSEKHGQYRSFFPFYGNMYERFWRDEYHYTLFPLYGRTVKNGTTTRNFIYPFFSIISGENESGFQLWPLYGQAEKKGVYDKRFILWPFISFQSAGMDTVNPTDSLSLLPLYASTRSPQRSSTYFPWPFTGIVRNGNGDVVERDIIWPFWMAANEKDSITERYLPFYAMSHVKDTVSRWFLWPIYHDESINSSTFRQEKFSLMYFLYSASLEMWPQAGKARSRSTFWPLYAFRHDEEGKRTLSLPALLEPVVWSDGVERNLAPLWRFFITTWDDKQNSATSLLWNLFWHERRGDEVAWEISPLLFWKTTKTGTGFKFLKGLFGYEATDNQTAVTILWLTFGGTRP